MPLLNSDTHERSEWGKGKLLVPKPFRMFTSNQMWQNIKNVIFLLFLLSFQSLIKNNKFSSYMHRNRVYSVWPIFHSSFSFVFFFLSIRYDPFVQMDFNSSSLCSCERHYSWIHRRQDCIRFANFELRKEKWTAKNDTMKMSCNHKFLSGHEYDHTF